jgi:hypothetical protein
MNLDLNDLVGNDEEAKATTNTEATAATATEAPAETATAIAEEASAPAEVAETAPTTTTEEASAPAETTETVTEQASAPAEVAETVTEEVAETVEAPAEPATTESATIGEAETITETATAPEAPAEPSIKTVSLSDYLVAHKDKIENATPINADFPSVPAGKHALFCTNEAEDASIYKVDFPNKLHFEEVTPDSIIVENSGIIITAPGRRIYAGKTNVVQFDIENDSPVKMSTFKKANPGVSPKVDVKELETVDMSVDEIKLHIKKVSPRLDAAVKELTTKEELKTAAVTFLGEIRDLNHLIKINEQVMMKCNL